MIENTTDFAQKIKFPEASTVNIRLTFRCTGMPGIKNTPENMIKIQENTGFQNTKADDT